MRRALCPIRREDSSVRISLPSAPSPVKRRVSCPRGGARSGSVALTDASISRRKLSLPSHTANDRIPQRARPAVESEQHQYDAGELMRQLHIGPVSLIVDRTGTTTARIDPDPSFFG